MATISSNEKVSDRITTTRPSFNRSHTTNPREINTNTSNLRGNNPPVNNINNNTANNTFLSRGNVANRLLASVLTLCTEMINKLVTGK